MPGADRASQVRSEFFFGGWVQHDAFTRVLLNDGEKTGVKKTDLKQHQERQGAVDAIRERVKDRRGEVQPKRELDQRLDDEALAIFLADPLVGIGFDAVLRCSRELTLLVEQRLEDRF